MLVIGSVALKTGGIPVDTPKDLDLIGTVEDLNKYASARKAEMASCAYVKEGKKAILKFQGKPRIVEVELAFEGNTAYKLLELIDLYSDDIILPRNTTQGFQVLNPQSCLALKLSHRYLKNSPHFLKTRQTILELRELGYSVPEVLTDWLKERETETYDYGHPSLMRSKGEFFNPDEGVVYKYEHDDIHKAIAIGPEPAYEYFKGDNKDVMVDEKKWLEVIDGIKLNSVLEESYTLALERCLIPFNFKHAPRRAFLMALEKCCTSIASGWWREFAWENYDKVLGLYSNDFVDKFNRALSFGRIRLYQQAA